MRLLLAVALVITWGAAGCGGCDNGGGGDVDAGDTSGCGDCAADQVCRYDTCVPTPQPCTDGQCPGDFVCDQPANECLPWGVGPGGTHDDQCTREVVPGVFFPGVQCEWLGPPAGDPFPDHRNVLGSPMVANLGMSAGEFASPSIVFVAYNFTD